MKISNIFLIARQTFKDIYQSKILMNVVFLGIFLVIIIFVASEFSYGVADRVALDVGLGCLSLSMVGISLFMGATLIQKEIENRTLYMVISRPVSRVSFYLGKMFGLSGILLVNMLGLCLFVFPLYYYFGGKYHYLIPWSLLFIYFESLIVLYIVVLLSLVSNTILTVLLGITLFAAGHAIEGVKVTSIYKFNLAVAKLVDFYAIFMPNLEKYNVKTFVLYDGQLSNTFLWGGVAYTFVWLIVLAFISSFIMQRKEFS